MAHVDTVVLIIDTVYHSRKCLSFLSPEGIKQDRARDVLSYRHDALACVHNAVIHGFHGAKSLSVVASLDVAAAGSFCQESDY